ncbi:MAG TPA: hypothetical protein VFY71_03910 [Planctomycetota bacterium]|nr:hypothetical protein [Planctomycetota bacterium]
MGPPAPRAPTIVLVLLVLAAGLFQVHDWDIELHARTGQWILQHGQVPTTNVMSELHHDYPTVDDKWGFQVAAHLLFDGLGPVATTVAGLALLLGLFLVTAGTARRLGADPWCALLCLALAVVASRARFTFRPDLLSLLLAVLFVRALLTRPPSARQALALLALQVVWVNVHGYFITGPLVVATAGLARLVTGLAGDAAERRRGAGLLLLSGALALACLLNPAGLDGALHPLRILADLRAHYDFYSGAIIEFRPVFAADGHASLDRLAFFVLAGCGALLALLRLVVAVRNARRDREELCHALLGAAVSGLFLAMAPSLRRNMAPASLVVAPQLAANVMRFLGPRVPGALPACALAAAVAFGELSDRTSVHDGLDRRAGLGRSAIAYPDTGIAFIARELPKPRVFTAFSWGSTFTGRRWPEQVASTDGNTHGYPTSYLIEVMSALSGEDALAFTRITDRDHEDAALLPTAGPLSIELLRDPLWALVCVGVRETVWVRRSAVSPDWLAQHDLLARWRAGEPPELPGTPRGALLGPLAAEVPLAEIDQSLLLMAAGLDEDALRRAQAASARVPGDPEAPALRGLLLERLGRKAEAADALRESLAAGGFNRLADKARAALQRLGG